MEDYFVNNFTVECTEEVMGPKRDSLYIVIPIIVIYGVIFLTGTIGNISTCIVISKNKSMHTATNYYLFSLAISDLLLLLSGLPQEIYLIYSRYPYIFGSAFCFLRGMFAETSANATVLTITAFTVERYLAICHPFLSHTMSKLSRAVKLILAIWLVAVGLAVPQAMQFDVVGPPDCEQCAFVKPIIQHSFEVSTLLFFVLPMSLITVLYILIGQKLKSSTMMKKRNVFGSAASSRVQTKSSRKVVKMLVAVVVAFFICWAPFHAQRLYSLYSMKFDELNHSVYLKIYEIVTYISGILYYMSATINPILYNIMSVKFREAFKETFSRCCCFHQFKASRPQRSYSVLSRSAQRGPDSTDSGRDDPSLQSHSSVTQKTSLESYNGLVQSGLRRNKTFSTFRGADIEEEAPADAPWLKDMSSVKTSSEATTPKFISIHLNATTPPHTLGKFWQYFECLAKRTFDDSKRLSAYYSSPVKEPSIFMELKTSPKKNQGRCTSPCEISNSSLKDVENGAIEDELTTYMKEVKRREIYS
ncbi:pyrokinin-1 receptor-like [Tribolium madens]|uniref:pyrokinin-1 receptor-like n=1 Tax=Tribolium madens TaxID=41895 RepID=UPI001CF72DC2|nr:pyrokinin-1 receptor-like [Tribolium madens]